MSDTIEEGAPVLATIAGYPVPVAGRYSKRDDGTETIITSTGTYRIESILEVGE